MGVMNVLANVSMPIYSQLHSVSLNWIGKIILWLTTVCGSVGVGIILFSLLLKLITLPFDVFQRINMRKQNIKMKENQARMEKLQKQYANDKDKYNQKVMEMYKESGISIMSSCLPMILSLVIFIVAINAFNAFASYSNVENYNTMVRAYNASMLEDCADIGTAGVSKPTEDTDFVLDDNGNVRSVVYTVEDENEYIYYTVAMDVPATVDNDTGAVTYITKATFDGYFTANYDGIKAYVASSEKKNYYLNWEKISTSAEYAQTIDDIRTEIVNNLPEGTTLTAEELTKITRQQAIDRIFVDRAQDEVVAVYNGEVKKDTKFLWVKNVWVVDASYKHPVLGYSSFSQEIVTRKSCSCKEGDKTILTIPAYTEDGYANVTGKLGAHKRAANGYYIMILLSIGTILLQQFLSMRSQKEQNKYSSVDGQSGSQQKMMMVIMTVMFAIFSFMYSSAFAIYLVVSNLFSLLSMLVINKLVDVSVERKAAGATGKGEKVLSGRAAAVQKSKSDAKSDKKNNKK